MRRVWIAQVLCPQRHTIFALTAVCDDQTEDVENLTRQTEKTMHDLLESKSINPWCGLCHAPHEKWRIEAGRTLWETLAEAEAPLRDVEAENLATGALYGEVIAPKGGGRA